MTTHLRANYSSNGEWLQLYTAPVKSGPLDVILPVESDVLSVVEPEPLPPSDTHIIDVSVGRGWVQYSSETGSFEIGTSAQEYVLAAFPLEDWMLTFRGLPRAHHRIRRDVMAGIFGGAGLAVIDEIFEATRPNHESIGDLRALQRSRGPLTLAEVSEQMGSPSFNTVERTIPDDLNSLACNARRNFVAQAVDIDRHGGVVRVPKAALIAPPDIPA